VANRKTRAWRALSGTALLFLCTVAWGAGGRAEVELTGTFGGEIEVAEGTMPTVSSLDISFSVRGEDWHTSLRATSTNEDWFSYLGFSDYRQIGELSLQSLLVFDPSLTAFTYFSSRARFRLLDVGFANYAYVPAQSSQAYDQVTLDGVAGSVRWRAVTRFALCPVAFQRLSFQANWPWTNCTLDISAFLSFTCNTGFERFRLTVTRREVPFLTFGSLITDFQVVVNYEVERKTLTPQLRTRTARTSFCLTPMLALSLGANPLSIDSLEVYGIKLECSLGNAVAFYAATSMTRAKNLELTGNADYFEVYRLNIRRPSCCDEDIQIEVAFYFEEASKWLFDWGMTTASIEFPVGREARWSLSMEIPGSAAWVLRVGWNWTF